MLRPVVPAVGRFQGQGVGLREAGGQGLRKGGVLDKATIRGSDGVTQLEVELERDLGKSTW